MQCGGWTIEWQGKAGNITPGTGILQAIKDTVGQGSTVAYDRNGLFKAYEGQTADVGIAVVGEMPYSEGVGDREDLSLSREDLALIERVKAKSKKLVVILISGRPLLVTDHLADWDALVAAWLPGTEGQGIADLLFGDHPFTGKLPYTWPASADQVPRASVQGKTPLFPFGYGLETKGTGKP